MPIYLYIPLFIYSPIVGSIYPIPIHEIQTAAKKNSQNPNLADVICDQPLIANLTANGLLKFPEESDRGGRMQDNNGNLKF